MTSLSNDKESALVPKRSISIRCRMGVLSHASSVLSDVAAAPLAASASSLDASQSPQEADGALTTLPPQASSLLFGTVSGESQDRCKCP